MKKFLTKLVGRLVEKAAGFDCGEDYKCQIRVDGKSHDVESMSLGIGEDESPDLKFLDFSPMPVSGIPELSIQWVMKFDALDDLVGKPLNLDEVNTGDTLPALSLVLPDQVYVRNDTESILTFQIDSLADGYVAGSFVGKNLVFDTQGKEEYRRVVVSGEFKVKVDRV